MPQSKPQPLNILRGHRSQIHTAQFIRDNDRLATGDAEGFVALWDLATMRPTAIWRAHRNSILSIMPWGDDRLITHGRDHHLIVWQVTREDETRLSSVTPLEMSGSEPPQPWIVHVLEVNSMNFCAFSACPATSAPHGADANLSSANEILVAVPNTLASEAIDIFELPSQARTHTVQSAEKTGMAMCLSIFHKNGVLLLAAAFENGVLSIRQLRPDANEWISIYRSQAHTQPVLSIGIDPSHKFLITSAADAVVAKHPVAPLARQAAAASTAQDSQKTVDTKHAGQQSLTIRSDGKIFATAGWDANIRVYSTKSLKELAVLQWHQVGVYAVAFATMQSAEHNPGFGEAGSENEDAVDPPNDTLTATTATRFRVTTVAQRRMHQAKMTHWVAAGAKDGKVSLWSVY